nr:MAG TPA: hypothetical protein [Caudoviricetes sp.]
MLFADSQAIRLKIRKSVITIVIFVIILSCNSLVCSVLGQK